MSVKYDKRGLRCGSFRDAYVDLYGAVDRIESLLVTMTVPAPSVHE